MRLACYLMLPSVLTAPGAGDDVCTPARHQAAPGAGGSVGADAGPALVGAGYCAKADARHAVTRCPHGMDRALLHPLRPGAGVVEI